MNRTESMEDLLVKLQTWISLMKMKGLWVILVKTEIMVSGINLDLMKESRKDPFGVCQTGVCSNAIFCDGCLCRIHKKYSGI